MLGLSLHGWENVMVGSLAFAALFAAIVGISTYCVVQLQREEISASKDDFERYKIDASKEIAASRSDADAKIGVAREEAKTAVEKAHADIAIANKGRRSSAVRSIVVAE
jgi:hypothetical protein